MRQKIYGTVYWKESCFALTAESLIEKAVDLKGVGGTCGGQNAPTNFLCLILKMLQVRMGLHGTHACAIYALGHIGCVKASFSCCT